ncbi:MULTISPECIES: Gp15 family bacteriophage protein [unclassified Gemella]|uniref:Gp15 family bacteriophage protein n=1 Tax=unclassified Gemella TaxID=2624949 RepID=UPI00107476F1|nr:MULTISPECIES: Gp15 family bacteriophage protein [unclassified Gemella]MBF0709723.1 hypothetical protein [Gemella sp. GL1.1]MBF0747240.1 hypothetical protein [Gemella sp. 19428wG2_WT2a]NYS27067.1 hypothetical protein [Gemella sp. GL1]TFU57828.1 hypothetical protein E4T67_06180 [Gemella sp. WT2a]
MLDISKKLKDEVIIKDEVYRINLAFDNVLRVLDIFNDDSKSNYSKIFIALGFLTGVNLMDRLTLIEAIGIYNKILDEYIKLSSLSDFNNLDLEGNPMPLKKGEKQEKRVYSLRYDGDYIFASFLQAYNIDLIEQQGKLHWKKFNALLVGLPKDTKFMQVCKIRSWKPSKGEDRTYKEQMRRLQEEYRLPDEDF